MNRCALVSFGSFALQGRPWLACLLFLCSSVTAQDGIIMTVQGPISPDKLGRTLVHEHVLCDFIGASKTGPHRYDPAEVVKLMAPHLREVRRRGFATFIDATPAYIGRDPTILRKLSRLVGLQIITNTGYYGAAGDKFVPEHARGESAAELASRWTKEWKDGILATGIRPGFIKIGVDAGPLSTIDRKLVEAASLTHLDTGLTIACHTGEGTAALDVLSTVEKAGVAPAALIIVHADGITPRETHYQLAARGAWVEYDGVGSKPIEKHVELIRAMLAKGFGKRILLSHDAGWYTVGESEGGKVRPYTDVSDKLLPALKAAGVSEKVIEEMLTENPRRAFTVRVRKRPS